MRVRFELVDAKEMDGQAGRKEDQSGAGSHSR